jgi:hypothetical protein
VFEVFMGFLIHQSLLVLPGFIDAGRVIVGTTDLNGKGRAREET